MSSQSSHTLARAVVFGTQVFRTVPLQVLSHADRRAAARSGRSEFDQDDFLLHRMTGLPLAAIGTLCLRDSQDLVGAYQAQAFDGQARLPAGTLAPAGFEYSLRRPLTLPDGSVRETLRLRELTRGDHKMAAQFSADEFDVEEFLMSRQAGLPIEDLGGLHIADSYELTRFFRCVVDAGEGDAPAGPGADAGDAAEPVGDRAAAAQ